MIHNIGPIGVAILVVGALLTLIFVRYRPAPGTEPAQDEPWTRNAPKPRPMTGTAPAPEAPEVQPQDIRPYANGAVSIGESSTPAISVRDLKGAAK